MGNDILLAMALFLGGAWYFILNRIIDTSFLNPSDTTLIVLSLMHYVLTVYLVLTMFLFYRRGLQCISCSDKKIMNELGTVDALLLGTWPAAVGAVFIAFAVLRLLNIAADNTIQAIFSLALVVFFIVLYTRTKNRTPLLSPSALACFVGIMAGGFIVYVLALSFLFADVRVSTDKEYYESGSILKVNVHTTGFVFLPSIEEVDILGTKYQKPKSLSTSQMNLAHQFSVSFPDIKPVNWQTQYYGEVSYRLQAIGVIRKGYFPIRFRPKDPIKGRHHILDSEN